MAVITSIVKAIIDSEDNPFRFEKFCADIYTKSSGIDIVITSRSWDLGRDGRAIGIFEGKYRTILCATLENDIDDKVESDIQRLAKTTITKTIVYCSSKSLTENKCDEIKSKILRIYPSAESVELLGQIQLCNLAERYEEIFRKYYGGEIKNLEEALVAPITMTKANEVGLRLALITTSSDDATLLRKELAKKLILDIINEKDQLTFEQISGSITALLHLPRTISLNYTRELTRALQDEDLVSINVNVVNITEKGKENVKNIPEEASSKLLEGRIEFRDSIKSLAGIILQDSQLDSLWNLFQEGITELFYSHGLAIVKMMRSALNEETGDNKTSNFEIPLTSFADRIVNNVGIPEQKEEIRQAIIDMFFEKDSDMFTWLSQICGTYVMLCSLGFESLSGEEISKALSLYNLIPDTDVVLSLLCLGENNHEEVERILSGWRDLGGKLFMVKPVLEEIAYHAWISHKDYEAFGENIKLLSNVEANRLIDNCFVRSFRKEANHSTSMENWDEYIKQYKGSSSYDYGNITLHLKDSGFNLIPEPGEDYKYFVNSVTKYLEERINNGRRSELTSIDTNTNDKIIRDSRLLAIVLAEREKARSTGDMRTFCIVSSARSLKDADDEFYQKLGDPNTVLSIAAMGFLLSLVPNVQMSFATLQKVLFDVYLNTKLTPLQRFACRVIASSGKFDYPWAKRPTLGKELRNTLYKQAVSRGENPKEYTEKVLKSDDPLVGASAIAETLDQLAVHSEDEQEKRILREQVKNLEEQLKKERAINKYLTK